ncbi:hypothetical protein OG413_20645 [Streptomyces sp. NBC_01433]|uniref:hypothetical protein n=1 Tax=Streptomyces sp. NBC_01433 TaxID=2903864 RepID=UPI002257C12B|nr:hypothetical protein [Streptomyces sp. NBC_01433]MCX4677684.1 hypothetical protein [Streptomyces sp. NBC_01433]
MNTVTSSTPVTIKNTSELAAGDIVRTLGMRVRLDSGLSRKLPGLTGRTAYVWTGTVLNLDEVRAGGPVPASFLRTRKYQPGEGWVTDRYDVWEVQGNERTEWFVENPS